MSKRLGLVIRVINTKGVLSSYSKDWPLTFTFKILTYKLNELISVIYYVIFFLPNLRDDIE